MLQGGLRRRTLLGVATVLAGGRARAGSALGQLEPIRWYAGPVGARTDPFVTWACETMHLRTGLRVKRTNHPETADVVCAADAGAAGMTRSRPIAWRNGCAGLTRRGAGQAGAEQFAAFLAGEAATLHALTLAQRR